MVAIIGSFHGAFGRVEFLRTTLLFVCYKCECDGVRGKGRMDIDGRDKWMKTRDHVQWCFYYPRISHEEGEGWLLDFASLREQVIRCVQ